MSAQWWNCLTTFSSEYISIIRGVWLLIIPNQSWEWLYFFVLTLTDTLRLIFPQTLELLSLSKHPYALDNLLFQLLIFFLGFSFGTFCRDSMWAGCSEIWCTYIRDYLSPLSWEFPSRLTNSEIFCFPDSTYYSLLIWILFWWRNTCNRFLKKMDGDKNILIPVSILHILNQTSYFSSPCLIILFSTKSPQIYLLNVFLLLCF